MKIQVKCISIQEMGDKKFVHLQIWDEVATSPNDVSKSVIAGVNTLVIAAGNPDYELFVIGDSYSVEYTPIN